MSKTQSQEQAGKNTGSSGRASSLNRKFMSSGEEPGNRAAGVGLWFHGSNTHRVDVGETTKF